MMNDFCSVETCTLNVPSLLDNEQKEKEQISMQKCWAPKARSCHGTYPQSDFPRKSVLNKGEIDLPQDRHTLCIRCIHRNKLDTFFKQSLEKRLEKFVKNAKKRSETRNAFGEKLTVEEAKAKWLAQGGTDTQGPICAYCQDRTFWVCMDPNSVRLMWERNEMSIPWDMYARVVSVDRIDASDDRLPYHQNIQFVCRLCNSKKAPQDIEDKRDFYWKEQALALRSQVLELKKQLLDIVDGNKNKYNEPNETGNDKYDSDDDDFLSEWKIIRDPLSTSTIASSIAPVPSKATNRLPEKHIESLQAQIALLQDENRDLKSQVQNANEQSKLLSQRLKEKCPAEIIIVRNGKRRVHYENVVAKKQKVE